MRGFTFCTNLLELREVAVVAKCPALADLPSVHPSPGMLQLSVSDPATYPELASQAHRTENIMKDPPICLYDSCGRIFKTNQE